MTSSKKKNPFVSIWFAVALVFVISTDAAFAQTTLLHYWSFNSGINAKQTLPAPPLRANYSYYDTNRAVVQYDTIPGTPKSTNVAPGTYCDSINGTAGLSSKTNGAYDNTTAGDTLNARLGYPAGNTSTTGGFRLRNPSWSSELRVYIPTTLYNNITIKYALQSSSTTSGQHYQIFAYSVDSGATWKTTNMTVNGLNTDTLDCTQSQYQSSTNFGLVTINLNDTAVNNNPRLVFRIRWAQQASTYSGNNRFDNLTVDGTPAPRGIALLHYWSFNSNINAKQTLPAPPLRANYSYFDTNRAVVQYDTIPGTPKSTNVAPGTYCDSINGTAGLSSKTNGAYDNTTAGDTLNARLGYPAGNTSTTGGFRLRNPSWSSELRVYIPTWLYSNITIKYALQSSSTTSGQHYQIFAYSVDSGATWKTTNMTVNGLNTDTLDCTQSQYQSSTNFGLVTINLNDTAVNNNRNLVFRIRWAQQASTYSGNNRFNNLTVESAPGNPTITISQPNNLDTLIGGGVDTIQYSITGKVSRQKTYSYSLDSGVTWNAIATDTGIVLPGGYGYVWTTVPVPLIPNSKAMVRAVDSAGTTGLSKAFTIIPVPKTISITNPILGDTLIAGQHDTLTFTTTGKVSKTKWIFYSLDSGITWNAAGTDTTNSFAWTVPAVTDPVAHAIIEVEDSAQVKGMSASFVILPVPYYPPDANLIYFWHYNGFSGAYTWPSIPNIPADYSAVPGSHAAMSYALTAGSPSQGLVEDGIGTSQNTQMEYPAGRALELANPSNGGELRFYIPTPDRTNIKVNFALQTSNGTAGPLVAMYDFSLDSGLTWQTTGLRRLSDSIDGAGYTKGNWGLISVDLSGDSLTSDNPKLVFRLRFAGNNSTSQGYVRIDNVTVTGPVGQTVILAAPTLVQYWNFNTLGGPYIHPNIPNIKADYSVIDTNAAYLEYYLLPGTSATWASTNNAGGAQIDNVASTDTTNLRQGAPSGLALRARNPVDSSELRWHIPSTGFHDLVVTFATQSSSTTSGDSAQIYSYSVDGGTTWKSAGMTVNGIAGNTLDLTQGGSTGPYIANFAKVVVTFGNDASVNNNPNLIFRIVCMGHTSLTSGNDRYDDFTLDGVPGTGPAPTSPLIHYWHFDSLNTAYHNPGIPPIPADYSVISPNPAKILYVLDSGTSSTYAGYIDNVAGDTTNAQFGNSAGNALRVRNPSDSMQLWFVIPSTGYNNISMTYALESSSTSAGQLVELFDYSTNGGTTWKSSAITVNGTNVDTLNVTQAQYQGSNWGLVTIRFGNDTSVNNNANLVLRIRFAGNTSLTSGNNRIENVTVDGTPVGQVENTQPSISVSVPHKGDTIYSGTHETITYAVTGSVSAARTIEYSTNGGESWITVAIGVVSTNYTWLVPQITSFNARVRVLDANGVIGESPAFVIIAPGVVTSVDLSASEISVGEVANIIWHASGYLGSKVNIDLSLNGKQTWQSIVQNYAYGANSWYTWTAPLTPDTTPGAVIRVTFAEGAVGYSGSFDIYPIYAGVSPSPSANAAVQVWPNPASRTVSISNPFGGNFSLSVFNATGRMVLAKQMAADENSLDVSAIAPGSYRFTIVVGAERVSGQFVIIH